MTRHRPLAELSFYEIRRLRLTAAQRPLADPARRIADIAEQTGFGMAMSHVFRRELGVSPKAYRKQVLGKRGE